MSFSIIMIIKKIFSVILRLSNNTKYLRPRFAYEHVFLWNIVRIRLESDCILLIFHEILGKVIMWKILYRRLRWDAISSSRTAFYFICRRFCNRLGLIHYLIILRIFIYNSRQYVAICDISLIRTHFESITRD